MAGGLSCTHQPLVEGRSGYAHESRKVLVDEFKVGTAFRMPLVHHGMIDRTRVASFLLKS